MSLLFAAWTMVSRQTAHADDLAQLVAADLPQAISDYEWFHSHPELSGEEAGTAKRLADAFRTMGLEVHQGIGGHGIVAILRSAKGSETGPVVLYRADMDGLPVTERTGLKYASKNPGVMHACGHDVHMAVALGAVRILQQRKDQLQGTLVIVGQPAEEVGKGARGMLQDKRFLALLKKIGKPKVALALHDAADLPAGQLVVISGFHHANVDSVDITVHGKGGHGAYPENAIDPIVIGAEIVMALQTIVSRKVPPQEPSVITVGKFTAGTKHNIIPTDATLLLTVRSYSDATRQLLLREIKRVAKQIALAHNAPREPEVVVDQVGAIPAAFNDVAFSDRLRTRFGKEFGAKAIAEQKPSLGGEDFGLFPALLGVPAVMWRIGAVDPKVWQRSKGVGLPSLHSDGFAPAAGPTLTMGIHSAVAAILESLTVDLGPATKK